MSEAPWLVAVCAGRWQLSGIRAARAAGLRVLALDGDAKAPGLAEADAAAVADVRDPAAVLEAVRRAGIAPAGAIAFVTEAGMPAAAALREAYRLPGPGAALTRALTDKSRQRELWSEAGVPGPRWEACRGEEEVEGALARIGPPAVLKPADSAGSRGVTKLELGMPWREAARAAFSASRSKTVLVESYLPGTEYTVETFACGGKTHVLAVTEKAKVPGTGGTVAQELATPDLERGLVDSIAATAVRALEALGHRDGPGHTELILGPDRTARLVESAGRGGGFMVFERLVPLASGFDIATACALQAVGRAPDPVPPGRRAVLLRFFPSRPGVVRAVEGFAEANAVPGVEAGPFVSVGERLSAARADADRMGYILSCSDSPASARALADRAQRMIRFTVEASIETTRH